MVEGLAACRQKDLPVVGVFGEGVKGFTDEVPVFGRHAFHGVSLPVESLFLPPFALAALTPGGFPDLGEDAVLSVYVLGFQSLQKRLYGHEVFSPEGEPEGGEVG